MNKTWTVYMHISPSGKRYIGITSKPVEERWKNGLGYSSQMFYRAIQKYGWDSFQHIIISENLNREQAEEMEAELIKKYNTRFPNGYNCSDGGLGSTGRYVSDEERRKTSERFKGKRISEEHRKKIIMGLKRRSPQIYQQVAIKNRNNNTKSVDRYTMEGQYIDSFMSIHEAERKLGFDYRNIAACCNGTQKSAYGFRWCFSGKKPVSLIHGLSKPVDQFELDGTYIRTFESITSAINELGLSEGCRCHISDCCNGKRNNTGGYMWKYHGGNNDKENG